MSPQQRLPMPFRKLTKCRHTCVRKPYLCPTIERLHKHVVPRRRRNMPERDAKYRNPLPISRRKQEDSLRTISVRYCVNSKVVALQQKLEINVD